MSNTVDIEKIKDLYKEVQVYNWKTELKDILFDDKIKTLILRKRNKIKFYYYKPDKKHFKVFGSSQKQYKINDIYKMKDRILGYLDLSEVNLENIDKKELASKDKSKYIKLVRKINGKNKVRYEAEMFTKQHPKVGKETPIIL